MKWATTAVLSSCSPEIRAASPSAHLYILSAHCLGSDPSSTEPMSLGVHVGGKDVARNSATWPKMKKAHGGKAEDADRYHPRPQTATLERPRILDIALLGKIDMTLTRKGLLSISSLCLAPIQKVDPRETKRNGSSIRDGRGGKTRKYQLTRKLTTDTEKVKLQKAQSKRPGEKGDGRWEDEENSVSDVPKTKKQSKTNAPKIPILVKQVTKEKRSPVHKDSSVNNNNNNETDERDNNNSKTCNRPVIVKKGVGGKRVDEVFGGPKATVDVPAPCTTCGRPEQPERFHSHPAPSSSRPATMQGATTRLEMELEENRKNRSATVKSSVRKPVAIKFRSGKSNRKAEEPAAKAAETPRASSATANKEKEMKEKEAPKARSGPRTVLCYLCGREFGSASFPLHEPHCLQRWQRENAQLPAHMQRPVPQKPEKPLSNAEWNKFAWEASQAHLVPCEHCGRTFNPDRLEVHQRSCRPGVRRVNFPNQAAEGSSSEAESGAGGGGSGSEARADSRSSGGTVRHPPTVYCYICGRMFGTASIGIHEPQCLDKWRVENSKLPAGKQRAAPVKPTGQCCTPTARTPSPPPPAPPPAAKGPRRRTVHCYLCGRQFGTASINIHEGQCLKKWRAENDKLPPGKRRPEPEKPDIKFTASGEIDYQGTMDAIWQSHLDQLVPCGQCGRTFNPDRLEVHERSCKGPKR